MSASSTARQSTVSEADALTTSLLRGVSDAQLMPFLFTAARALRAASPTSNAAAPVDADYVGVLLTSRFARSDSADVRQLVGCILCDLVRLSGTATATSKSTTSTAALPFPESTCDEVVACLMFPFAEVVRTRGSLSKCARLIEAASASHVFARILPHCRASDLPKQLQPLFDVIAYAGTDSGVHGASTGSGARSLFSASATVADSEIGGGSGRGGGGGGDGDLSSSATSEMVRVLVDVLGATHDITADQLRPLVQEIVHASRGLRRATGLASHTGPRGLAGGKSTSGSATFTSASSSGALIASRLLAEQADVLASAVSTYAMGFVETGLQEITAAELTSTGAGTSASSPAAAEEKRGGLRHLARAMEVLVAMGELDPALVAELVASLVPLLQHDSPDVRLVVFRGFSASIAASQEFFRAYRHGLGAVLACFQDIKPAIRLEATETAGSWMDAAVRDKWAFKTTEQLWRAVQPALERNLTDSHVLVRRQAVMAMTHMALVAPSVVIGTDGGGGGASSSSSSSSSSSLANSLGLRTADKSLKVRQSAVPCLCKLYREQLLPWIPDAVANTVNAESGLFLVEGCFERLLPPPTKLSSPRNSAEILSRGTSTTATGANPHGGGVAAAELALFDFEKDGLREERGFVDALVQLCVDLSPPHFATIVSMMRKKPQLRTAVARLFELREAIKLADDPKASEGQTIIHNIHRLLDFLQNMTHAEKGEWDALFRAKDDRVSKAFLRVCADDQQALIVDWATARDDLVDTLKGRLDANTSAFVFRTLAPMMMFPAQLAHLEALLAQLQQALAALATDKAAASATKGSHEALQHQQQQQQQRVLGMLRALLLLVTAAPGFLAHVSKPLLELLTLTTKSLQQVPSSTSSVSSNITATTMTAAQTASQSFLMRGECCLLVLTCVKEWANYAAAAGDLAAHLALGTRAKPTQKQQQHHGSSSSSSGASSATPTDASMTAAAEASLAVTRHPLVGVTEAMKQAALKSLASLCEGEHVMACVTHLNGESTTSTSKTRHSNASARAAGAVSEDAVASSAAEAHWELAMVTRLSKEAARDFGALIAIPSFGSAADLRSLLDTLCARVQPPPPQKSHTSSSISGSVQCACCLSALRAFLQDKQYATLLPADVLEPVLTSVLLGAVQPCASSSLTMAAARHDVGQLKVKTFTAAAAAASGTAQPKQLPRLFLPLTTHTLLVDKAAKALAALALIQPAERRPAVVTRVLDVLLCGYKQSCEGKSKDGTNASSSPSPATAQQLSTVGACQTRLAIDKQLAKLLVTPSSDIGKELAVSVLLSAEGEECVREPVQRKLVKHSTCAGSRADMRYVALLVLTAISEDSRQGYQQLRGLVQTVGDHLRQLQTSSGASLSSPQALFCYLEYTVPFLILFQAHHTYYESESTSHFTAYQRVWHLLMEELFRYGTQCAGFVSELINRIKQADDVLDRTSDRHRVLCDLACRVMMECLSQRQAGIDSAKRYPGVVLLPNFFAKSTQRNSPVVLSTVYLDDAVHVFANAPFRAPTSANTGGKSTTTTTTTTNTAAAANEEEEANPEDNGDLAEDHEGRTGAAQHATRTSTRASPSTTPRASLPRSTAAAAGTAQRPRRGGVSIAASSQDSMEADERELTPYGQLATTPASASRKRPSRSPQSTSPAAGAAMAKRKRAEAPKDHEAVSRAAVEDALGELVQGLHKGEIAAMRWKAVRSRIEAALDHVQAPADDEEGESTSATRTELMEYAKELLKKHYADAPV